MQVTKQKEIREKFVKDFCERFYNIARMADRRDDVGYGKGLARLQIDIDDWIISEFSTLLAERDAEVEKLKFILKDINSFEEDGEIGTLCEQGLSIISKLDGK